MGLRAPAIAILTALLVISTYGAYYGYIIIDNSGSMNSSWDELIDGYLQFVNDLPIGTTLGVYAFYWNETRWYVECGPKLMLEPTQSVWELEEVIRMLKPDGPTPLAQTIDEALNRLVEETPPGAEPVLVIFTDGEQMCPYNPDYHPYPNEKEYPCYIIEQFRKNHPNFDVKFVLIDYSNGTALPCLEGDDRTTYIRAKDVSISGKVVVSPDLQLSFTSAGIALKRAHSCYDNADCFGRDVCIDGVCKPANLHIALVPFNWIGGTEEFRRVVPYVADALKKGLPLDKCPEKLKITVVDDKTVDFYPKGERGESRKAIFTLLKAVEDLGLHEVDFVIGISDDWDSFEMYAGKGVVGYTYVGVPAALVLYLEDVNDITYMTENGDIITLQVGAELAGSTVGIVALHELGHKLGLVDEYCWYKDICGPTAYPNPLRAEYGCDPYGDCCWCSNSMGVCCKGNLEVDGKERSAMSASSLVSYAFMGEVKEGDGNISVLILPHITKYSKPGWEYIKRKHAFLSCDYNYEIKPPGALVVVPEDGPPQAFPEITDTLTGTESGDYGGMHGVPRENVTVIGGTIHVSVPLIESYGQDLVEEGGSNFYVTYVPVVSLGENKVKTPNGDLTLRATPAAYNIDVAVEDRGEAPHIRSLPYARYDRKGDTSIVVEVDNTTLHVLAEELGVEVKKKVAEVGEEWIALGLLFLFIISSTVIFYKISREE